MHPRIILAAVAALSIASLTAPADAGTLRYKNVPAIDVAAIPAYPMADQREARHAGRQPASQRVGASRTRDRASVARQALPRPSLAERTLGGYADRPAPEPTRAATAGLGLVTVRTAAGLDITCSAGFAGPAAALIAAAVERGIRFRRITCYSTARSHRHHRGVCVSNHCSGEAFDSHPSIPAQLVRQHGLRSGCDFRDCPHVDNARNVGGIAFWNSVRHGRGTATYSGRRLRATASTANARN